MALHFAFIKDVLIIRASGAMRGGAMYDALLTIAQKSQREDVENTRTVLLDFRDVASYDLANSDAAYVSFMKSRLFSLGANALVDADFVWVVDEKKPATAVIVQRQRRIGHSDAARATSIISSNYASALETLEIGRAHV